MPFKPSDLTVIVPFANPCNWRSRLENLRRAEQGLIHAGVTLVTVETVQRGCPYQLPDREGVTRIRLVGQDMLWFKENQFDIGYKQLPAKAVAIIDGDILFTDPGWPAATLAALEHHPVVQITSSFVYLGPQQQVTAHWLSYMALYREKRAKIRALDPVKYDVDCPIHLDRHGYPGGAWAWRREALDAVGGLPDFCIIGAGDQHVAWGLTETPDRLITPENATAAYAKAVEAWRARCAQVVRRDVGLVPGTGLHLWHGNHKDRKYPDRWRILRINDFDPEIDIKRDHQGVIALSGNKLYSRDDIRAYFQERNEDSTDLPATEPTAARPTPKDDPGHHDHSYLPHHKPHWWDEFMELLRHRPL